MRLLGNHSAPPVHTEEFVALSEQLNPDFSQEKIFIAIVRRPAISLFEVLRRPAAAPIDAGSSPPHEPVDNWVARAAPAQDL